MRLRRCAGCLMVAYCSDECGLAAWRGGHDRSCWHSRRRAQHELELGVELPQPRSPEPAPLAEADEAEIMAALRAYLARHPV